MGRSPEAKAYFEGHPYCELCDLLGATNGYPPFASAWDGAFIELHVHHVFTPPRWHHEANLVTACSPCHAYCHEGWQQAGRLACVVAKLRNATLDIALAHKRWRRQWLYELPGEIKGGIFSGRKEDGRGYEPTLLKYAYEVLTYHGLTWPEGVPMWFERPEEMELRVVG